MARLPQLANLRSWVRANRLALASLFVTWLIFFSRVLVGGEVYFFDDLKTIFYPLEYAYGLAQHAGELPMWSPLFGFGHPLLAWGQLGFFTPLHVLLRLIGLHPLLLLNISILAYFAFGLFGMFAWLRSHRLQPWAAAIGASVFVFCGFHIGHLNHVNFYTATMWLPWLLWAIDSFLKKPTLLKTALLALAGAVIPLSGQPQISLYTLSMAAIYGAIGLIILFIRKSNQELRIKNHASASWLTRLIRNSYFLIRSTFFKAVVLIPIALGLFLALSSFATLPLREFLPDTDRAADLPPEELYEFSYPPKHALTLIQPYYFGNHERYWGAKNFQELAAYVGFLPLLLVPLALLWRNRNHARLRIVASLWILIAALFAPGIYSPLYHWLVESHLFPPLAVPGRFVYFFDVGVAVLAAVGAQHLLTYFSSRIRRPQLIGVGLFLIISGNLIWWGWNYNPLTNRAQALTPSPLAAYLQHFTAAHKLPPRLYAAQSLPIADPTAALRQATDIISPTFTIHQPLKLTSATEQHCLSLPTKVGASSPDSAIDITASRNLLTPPFYQTKVTHAELTRLSHLQICLPTGSSQTGETIILSFSSNHNSGIKLLQRPLARAELPVLYVRVAHPSAAQLADSQKDLHLVIEPPLPPAFDEAKGLLLRHLNVTADSSSARWVGALAIHTYRAFIEQFLANDRPPIDESGTHALLRYRYLVDMAGITHVTQDIAESKMDTDPVIAAGYTLVGESEEGEIRLRLYENPEAFPKAFLVGGATWEPAAENIRVGLMQKDYSPKELIYVSGERPPTDLLTPGLISGEASITRYESSRVDVETKTSQAAWLVLTDASTPAWQATIDDQPAPIFIANSVFRTVAVPAGQHTVSFYYASPAVEQAKKLTSAGLVALALCFLPWRRLKSWNISSMK